MKEKLSRAARASKSVYNAGGEHYHFNMGCLVAGEARMLAAMQAEIMESRKIPFEDAAVAAAAEFKMMKRLESGEERFKSIREKASAPANQASNASELPSQGLLA
ncbi:hypothetical protein ULG90_15450 [Halopseudomonas pachastrellae]|nr:hypothetical protein UMZ34_07350 [Halopseudomonas pachastrellae]WVM91453.1 hypothetical protein ULG90_15450 [Halopseudomonas pachastrellae]|tara:strand:- start:1807 stop:2121 length:315 start_codon:yes stop_codon:yes gene_type:complete